jgi:hypothetical protein
MDYKLQGSFDQPHATVQPGSLLTPGILKNLHDSGDQALDKDKEQP